MNMTQMKEETMENKLEIRCSKAERIIACPGSALAESKCPKDPGNEFTRRGKAIHEWLERAIKTGDVSPGAPLSDDPEEYENANSMLSKVNDILAAHGGVCKDPITGTPMIECEFHLDAAGWTGTPDLVVLAADDTWSIFDYKTGWAEVPHPSENKQLYLYSALLREMDIIPANAPIHAHIITPRAAFSAEYSVELLTNITIEAKKAAELARKPDAERRPSVSACQYCRARCSESCPESLKTADNLKQATEVIKPPSMSIQNLPADVLCNIKDQADLLADVVEQVEAEMKRRLNEDAFAFQGRYRLKPGREITQITDTDAAITALNQAGISRSTILEGMTISPKAVADAYKLQAGLTSKKSREIVDTALMPYAEKKQASPSLCRERKAIEQEAA